MDDSFSQLPRAAVLVYAAVLAAGVSREVLAAPEGDAADEPAAQGRDSDVLRVAPTCREVCHSNAPPLEAPPPLDPAPKRSGCAVEPDLGDLEGSSLALVGLGLGLAATRRRHASAKAD